MIGYTLTNALQSKLLQFSVNHGIMNHQNSRILRILMPKRHTALEFITAYFVECAYASRCIGSERSVTLEKFRLEISAAHPDAPLRADHRHAEKK